MLVALQGDTRLSSAFEIEDRPESTLTRRSPCSEAVVQDQGSSRWPRRLGCASTAESSALVLGESRLSRMTPVDLLQCTLLFAPQA